MISSQTRTPLGPWLNVSQIAAYLGLTTRAVRELEFRHVLPGHRFERSLKFSLTEIDELLVGSRQPTLNEMASGEICLPPGPIGPLMPPENAAAYMGLSSTDALHKRTLRLQVPVYRISSRILRYRAVELDNAVTSQRKPLTGSGRGHILKCDACLPERKEVNAR